MKFWVVVATLAGREFLLHLKWYSDLCWALLKEEDLNQIEGRHTVQKVALCSSTVLQKAKKVLCDMWISVCCFVCAEDSRPKSYSVVMERDSGRSSILLCIGVVDLMYILYSHCHFFRIISFSWAFALLSLDCFLIQKLQSQISWSNWKFSVNQRSAKGVR